MMPIAKKNDMQQTLSFDDLESRVMLAGNVDVFVQGDNLIINGDIFGNQIEINAFDDDIIRVTGLTGTGINGVNEGTAQFEIDDLNNIFINTEASLFLGGQDSVAIQNNPGDELELDGGIIYNGAASAPLADFADLLFGAGDNLTIGGAIEADGTSTIAGSNALLFGGDSISLTGGEYDGLNINAGLGADIVNLTGVEVEDGVALLNGGGAPAPSLSALFFPDTLNLAGNDFDEGSNVISFEIV